MLRQYTFARIHYPEGKHGLLIYLKPSFTGREELDLTGHRLEHPEFPHDPTTNLIYDENHVESYRQLGESIARRLCRDLQTRALGTRMDLQAMMQRLAKQYAIAMADFPEEIAAAFRAEGEAARPTWNMTIQGPHGMQASGPGAPIKDEKTKNA